MPKPPPPPPPPPPSPSGDTTAAGGKSVARKPASSSSSSAGSTVSRTPNGAASLSSPDANSSAKRQAGAVAEGVVDVPGLVTKTRSVSEGHSNANATRTDLNGGKTVRRRRTTPTATGGGKVTPTSLGKSRAKSTSLPRKGRVAGAATSAGGTRKLKRRPRSPTSGGSADGTPGVKALVVTDDMELADMMALVKDVLERLGETERELRRLRKEGSLAKPNRPEVRDRKFVIDTRAKMLGAAFAGAVAGMIVGWSVLPNLWLVGGVTGAVAFAALSRSSNGTAGSICSTCGIQVALIYKDIRDWWEQTVFLYKTGKLSYTYWRGFERYDQAWGLSTKYTETVAKLSKEALELDRQYKIRQKTLRAGKRLTQLSKQVGSSAAKEVTTIASSATGWGTNQLRQWGLLGDDPDAVEESPGVFGGLLKSKKRLAGARGGSGAAKRRPLGFSVLLDGVFGERSRSIYSAPPAGGTRKPGYRGDPVIPARIRHMFMTSKQIRDERLQKYRVGFMGMRLARSFDKDD
eukprot:g6087.t1